MAKTRLFETTRVRDTHRRSYNLLAFQTILLWRKSNLCFLNLCLLHVAVVYSVYLFGGSMVPLSKTHLGLSESVCTQVKPDKRLLREHDSLARQPSVGSTRRVEVAAVVYACDVYVCMCRVGVCVYVCVCTSISVSVRYREIVHVRCVCVVCRQIGVQERARALMYARWRVLLVVCT